MQLIEGTSLPRQVRYTNQDINPFAFKDQFQAMNEPKDVIGTRQKLKATSGKLDQSGNLSHGTRVGLGLTAPGRRAASPGGTGSLPQTSN